MAMLMLICTMAASAAASEAEEEGEAREYTLEQVVVLSRHNIRSPLSGKGSLLDDITPHEWFPWTSNAGELSLKGAMLETTMGQYFRLWLENEGLFPENYIPKDGAVRFYANGLQRTQATAHYFSTGLLPVSVSPVERHVDYDELDTMFLPIIRFMNDGYDEAIQAEISEKGGGEGLSGYAEKEADALKLLMEVTDMEESEGYKSGTYGNLLEDESVLTLEPDKEPAMSGPMKTATSVADALVLQYYEETDDQKAAFGHEMSEEDWKAIGGILGNYQEILFMTEDLAVNLAHPMLKELYAEMNAQGREFTFLCGHDSTIASTLSALGVEDYTLPGAIEPQTPIGSKLVFERWRNQEGEAFYKVSLVYQSVEQLREIQPLSLENPPMIVALSFKDVPVSENGMIAEKDLMDLFRNKIDAFGEIQEAYSLEEAA